MSPGSSPIDRSLPRSISLWLPVVIWCGVIFYFSSLPHLRITEAWWDLLLRKIAHMVEYGILTGLLMRAFRGSTAWASSRILGVSLGLAVAYACTDEYHQSFVAGRVGCLTDVGIDGLGAWMSWLIPAKRDGAT